MPASLVFASGALPVAFLVSDSPRVPSDITTLTNGWMRIRLISPEQLRHFGRIEGELILVDVTSFDSATRKRVISDVKRLKSERQRIVIIAVRRQLSELGTDRVLDGNSVIFRPMDFVRNAGILQSLLRSTQQQNGEPGDEATAKPPRHHKPEPDPNIAIRVSQTKAELEQLRQNMGAIGVSTDVAVRTIAGVLDLVFSLEQNPDAMQQSDLDAVSHVVSHVISTYGLGRWVETVRSSHVGTYQHCLLVTGSSIAFAQCFGFREVDMQRIAAAALIHDIGKIAIPPSILDKRSALTPQEFDIVKQHTTIGYRIVRSAPGFSEEIADVVLSHHEYLDGSGYPHGIAGEQICDLVRFMTISDIYSALIERRSYKEPCSTPQAFSILTNMKGKLDQPLVRALERTVMQRHAA
jgi:putative nucleotidyltransferase with HDIG domain